MQARQFISYGTAALAFTLSLSASDVRADVPNEPASIDIVDPADGAMFEGPTATISVVTDAYAGDEGISSVALRVDGETVATADASPWNFADVELDEGMHELVAVLTTPGMSDYASSAVNVVVFAGSGESGTSGGETAGETTDEGGDEDSSGGCAVRSTSRLGTSGAMILLGLFCLGLARQRRRD